MKTHTTRIIDTDRFSRILIRNRPLSVVKIRELFESRHMFTNISPGLREPKFILLVHFDICFGFVPGYK